MANDAGDSKEVGNPSLNPDGEWLTVPVELAAARGEKELTGELLRAGEGGGPIYEAIQAGQHDVVKHLRQEPEHHHLQVALGIGDEAIVSLLLELGADAGPEDHWIGVTPEYDWRGIRMTENALHLGAIGGHVDVIEEIIKRQPSTMSSVAECTGYTALHYAANQSQLGVIDALVEAGADLEAEGGLGVSTAFHVDPIRNGSETSLSVAVEAHNVCAAKELASAGADVREHPLRESAEKWSNHMLIAMLGHGAHVNTKGASDGNTPLHLAAEKSFRVKVDVLLQAGAHETAVNHNGQTPLDVIGLNTDTMRTLVFGNHREEDAIRTLLVNAPKEGRIERGLVGVSFGKDDEPSDNRSNAKRVATAKETGGVEGPPSDAPVEEGATAFRAAMGRLIGLEVEVVFRTVLEFV
ncbi:unnamed protein product [Ectocarpus sp. CCAP 1310/34]|nr:unnamed protein product [Ectocarpus sp. CCAP 1310/34]